MTGLLMILRSMGVKIEEQHIHQLEVIIPQIPQKAQQVLIFVKELGDECRTRLTALEKNQQELMEVQKEINESLKQLGNVFRTQSARDGGNTDGGNDTGTGNSNGGARYAEPIRSKHGRSAIHGG
jgi:hypothetical protein